MQYFLYPGQRFRFVSSALPNIVHETLWIEHCLTVCPKKLRSASTYEDIVYPGEGPKKGQPVSTKFHGDIAAIEWTVSEVDLTGGGTGHGPHDIFPDGNQVTAFGPEDLRLEFMQSGCFTGMVGPARIELLNSNTHPDEPRRWKMVQVVR